MRVEADRWLTDVYGAPAFRVTVDVDESLDPVTCTSRFEASSRGGPAFFYARVSTVRTDQVRALTRAGFDVIDVAVTFDRAPAPDAGRDSPIEIRTATTKEHEAAMEIAGSSFKYSRFHLDSRVPGEVANRIKREWIRSYCLGRRGDRLMVALVDGQVAGFLAVIFADIDSRRAKIIDLIGVAKEFQGRGVGEQLVREFNDERDPAIATLRVGTQAANTPSLRLYEKCGYRIAETAYVLHRHAGAVN